MTRHDYPTVSLEPTPDVLEEAMRRSRKMRSQAMWDTGVFLVGLFRGAACRLGTALRLPVRRPAP